MIIDGEKIAEKILNALRSKKPPSKYLAVFLVGDDESSLSFVKKKEKVAEILGIDFRIYKYKENISQDFLRSEIHKIGDRKNCGGVIVQLPLPAHINKNYVCNAISEKKDIDVLGERAKGAFYNGRGIIFPPAVEVVQEIIVYANKNLSDSKVAIIGAGNLVGKPIALFMLDKSAKVTVFGIKSENLEEELKNFDIVISGVGKRELFGPEMLKENSLVIDFGYSFFGGKVYGDFESSNIEAIKLKNISYTPTPGGTGPILVMKLFENFYNLNLPSE
jgi:methylenetetrahydrofolate dehydrogenase (NADP+)/methenyltetrahydrofolate cyclohydrolase